MNKYFKNAYLVLLFCLLSGLVNANTAEQEQEDVLNNYSCVFEDNEYNVYRAYSFSKYTAYLEARYLCHTRSNSSATCRFDNCYYHGNDDPTRPRVRDYIAVQPVYNRYDCGVGNINASLKTSRRSGYIGHYQWKTVEYDHYQMQTNDIAQQDTSLCLQPLGDNLYRVFGVNAHEWTDVRYLEQNKNNWTSNINNSGIFKIKLREGL